MLGYYTITKPRLSRAPLLVTETETAAALAKEAREIAEKAERTFGHTTTRKAISHNDNLLANKAIAAKIFAEIGFEPLDFDKVKKYKAWMVRKHHALGKHELRWAESPLGTQVGNYYGEYNGIVPAFALSRALELKEKFPSATFAVESPVFYDKTLPDPFLRMDWRGLCFYVEVWDELEFEGRRTV